MRFLRTITVVAALAVAPFIPSLAAANSHPNSHASAVAKHHSHARWVAERHHAMKVEAAADRRAVVQSWYGITPAMMAPVERVSICEEGGNWAYSGTAFDGGIGWMPALWQQYRKPSWPYWMHDAPPHMQANAMYRFVARQMGGAWPDTGACAGY